MNVPSSNLIETKLLEISFFPFKISEQQDIPSQASIVEIYKSGQQYYFGKNVEALKAVFDRGLNQTNDSFVAPIILQIKEGTIEDAALSRKAESDSNKLSHSVPSLVEAKPCNCTSNTYPNPEPTWFINPTARPNLLADDFHAGYQDLVDKSGLRYQGNREYERGWYTALGCFHGFAKRGMIFSHCNYLQGYLIGAGLSNMPDSTEDLTSLQQQYPYQVGGCLTPFTPTYVSRDSDRELIEELSLGEYCFVVANRQMGKTSLANRVLHRFRKQDKICVYLDLTSLGDCNNSASWYRGFIRLLGEELSQFQKVEFENTIEHFDYFLPLQKVGLFLDNILSEFKEREIVIFLDEIDSLIGGKPSLDEFLGFIRSCYNKRGHVYDYRRLTFCLLGTEHPSKLVNSRTPFNIGRSIQLEPFKLYECSPMLLGLSTRASNSQYLLEKILSWTGGQPFLTQKVCDLIYKSPIFIAKGEEGIFVDKTVREQIVDDWQLKDSPAHLETIYTRLLSPQFTSSKQVLEMYEKILKAGKVMVDNSLVQRELLRSGLVLQKNGHLQVFNRIYREVFNSNWTETIVNETVTGDLLTIINSH